MDDPKKVICRTYIYNYSHNLTLPLNARHIVRAFVMLDSKVVSEVLARALTGQFLKRFSALHGQFLQTEFWFIYKKALVPLHD